MATETISATKDWPTLGQPAPPPMNSATGPAEWEMIAEEHNENTTSIDNHVVILPSDTATEAIRTSNSESDMIKGRPRSATIGVAADAIPSNGRALSRGASGGADSNRSSSSNFPSSPRRALRRCASTPDLLISDHGHEVIVEDESDSEEEASGEGIEMTDADLIEAEDESGEGDGLDESFEVLSDDKAVSAVEDDEPVMIDEDTTGEEESATLVSTPSVGTSSWTMATASSAPQPSVWGMKKSPSFAEMLAKNIDSDGSGIFGQDKAATEAKLRDSHRKHHLRVRTKPKFIVTEDTSSGKKMMKHAHSTGDLTKMLSAVEEGHESSFGQGRRNRRVKKQLSAMMEEDEEGDFVIGRGNGTSSGGGGCGGDVEIMGDTDAMDYYHRKEQGSRSTSNKKKERPDEAKRKEISMHKKEMQRKKQMESQKGKGSGTAASGGGKKKKNDKGFGGKKERRRL